MFSAFSDIYLPSKNWKTIYKAPDNLREVQINKKNGEIRSSMYDMCYGGTYWAPDNHWVSTDKRSGSLAKQLKNNFKKLNIDLLLHPAQILSKKKYIKPNTVAISGLMNYSDNDAKTIDKFLTGLKTQMGVNDTGFVTSPTPWGKNIDAIVTNVEGKFNSMPLFSVPDEFGGYMSPDQVPENLKKDYTKAVKNILPDKAANSEAIAKVSKSIVVFGGGGDSLLDSIKQVKNGNKVSFVNLNTLPKNGWDNEKNRPKNAFVYLKQVMEGYEDRGRFPKHLPEYKEAGFTLDYVKKNYNKLKKNIQFIDNLDAKNINSTIKQVIKHIR